jgi:site-specific recombinase XerD
MTNKALLDRFVLVKENQMASSWLKLQINLLLSNNIFEAYARALEGFLKYIHSIEKTIQEVTCEQIAGYIHLLAYRPINRQGHSPFTFYLSPLISFQFHPSCSTRLASKVR